jgi:hypothetical protein
MDADFQAVLSQSCETFEVGGERLHVGMLPEFAIGIRTLFGYIEVWYRLDLHKPVSRHPLPALLPVFTICSTLSLRSTRVRIKPLFRVID